MKCCIAYLRILFFCSSAIAYSRKSYTTLQMSVDISCYCSRSRIYTLSSAVWCQLDNSFTYPYCIRHSPLLFIILTCLHTYSIWAMGLSVYIILFTLQNHDNIDNTRGYLCIFMFSPSK